MNSNPHHIYPGWFGGNSCIVEQHMDPFSATDPSNLWAKQFFHLMNIICFLQPDRFTEDCKTVQVGHIKPVKQDFSQELVQGYDNNLAT